MLVNNGVLSGISLVPKLICLVLFGAACSPGAWAQPMQPYQEYDKKIRAFEQVQALKSDLFGDSINVYDQSTSFVHNDIDLAGSSALRVSFSRRLNIRPIAVMGQPPEKYGGLADWDIEVPHISGTFDGAYGWNITAGGKAAGRCSTNFYPRTLPPRVIEEIWSGYIVSIPGESPRSLIALPPTQFKKPDGQTRLWTTSAIDTVSCTTMASGYPGEGFILETVGGIKYFFNVGTIRSAGAMGRDSSSEGGQPRIEVFIMAGRVEDRFGNWVTYAYNGNGHPTNISSSDGRSISLAYSGNRLVSASSNGRTWVYSYSGNLLSAVTLPDQSVWRFNHLNDMRIAYELWTEDPGPNCGAVAPLAQKIYQLQITHPAGAVGLFRFDHQRHYRAGVPSSYCQPEAVPGGEWESAVVHRTSLPNYFDVLGITSKAISGPGISVPNTWEYLDYGGYQATWPGYLPPCLTCQPSKVVVTVQPDGSIVEEEYGIVFSLNEGKLLRTSVSSAAGALLSSEFLTYMSDAQVVGQPFPPRYGSRWGGTDESAVFVRPLFRRVTKREGIEHVWQVNAFDSFARPTSITQSSAPTP